MEQKAVMDSKYADNAHHNSVQKDETSYRAA